MLFSSESGKIHQSPGTVASSRVFFVLLACFRTSMSNADASCCSLSMFACGVCFEAVHHCMSSATAVRPGGGL